MTLRIAGIQLASGPDGDRNTARAVEMAAVAAEKGARIIGFPELCLTPWFLRDEDPSRFALARTASDASLQPFVDVSRTRGIVLVLPFFESAEGKYYNSAAVIDRGQVLGVERKVHLPNIPHYREQFYFSPGDADFPVFTTSQGRIGIQICWDNLFPEGTRILALKGADVVFAPTAASQAGQGHWERAVTANAFANHLFIFQVNRVGQEAGMTFTGRSFCADPWGEMVSELAGSREAIVLADVDLKEREAADRTWGFLRHRRPEQYRDILNTDR